MPTLPGRSWNPRSAGVPPRVSDADHVIWLMWQDELLGGAIATYWDVGLGPGEPIPPGTDEALARMWTRNTQERADIIIEHHSHVVICELRHRAETNAIGRLLGYAMLYDEDRIHAKPARLTLATDRRKYVAERLAQRYGITYLAP